MIKAETKKKQIDDLYDDYNVIGLFWTWEFCWEIRVLAKPLIVRIISLDKYDLIMNDWKRRIRGRDTRTISSEVLHSEFPNFVLLLLLMF